jgi:hypothetical protein
VVLDSIMKWEFQTFFQQWKEHWALGINSKEEYF